MTARERLTVSTIDPPLVRTGQGDYTQDYTPETDIAEDDHDAAGLLFEASTVATIFCVAAFAGGLVGGVVAGWWGCGGWGGE